MTSLGPEATRLDQRLSVDIAESDREAIWDSAKSILATHQHDRAQSTLALGYVQSGKTTSMAALCAVAADEGYRVVVAILGSTNLLVDQNRLRLETYLGLEEHNYNWVSEPSVRGVSSSKSITSWLEKGRTVFIPVIKHATQLRKVAAALAAIPELATTRILIIDDEADQASLNTRPQKSEPSRTYAAIQDLRSALPFALYVQYTATPYAPLLLDEDDTLMPTAVEFLTPGTGYTGGREFFIEFAETVIRPIPFTDEASSRAITSLPLSLERALAAYVAGAAILYRSDARTPPISMLVHATHRTDGQALYHYLLDRFLQKLRASKDLENTPFGLMLEEERDRLTTQGVERLEDRDFWETVSFVLKELSLWLVNSASDVKKISWNYSPFHVLIGGNKLDRGFTVVGLTVTYMNRKASEQIDTLEQRARAFGYRRSLLPYCQVFATPRTIRLLQGIVHTEDDLRANLRDWIDGGGRVSQWAEHVGLILPTGAKPTRNNVISSLRHFNADGDWHALRRPNLDEVSRTHNAQIITNSGLLNAPKVDYGRLAFRTLELTAAQVLESILAPWAISDLSPSWRHDEICSQLHRHPDDELPVTVVLLARDDEKLQPRERSWVDDLGFVNLFQGRDLDGRPDPRYEGDRSVGLGHPPHRGVVLQVHYVHRRDHDEPGIFTLAIHLGDCQTVRVERE